MTSHSKPGRSRPDDGSQPSDAQAARASQRDARRQKRDIRQLLSSTKRRVLAFIAAVSTVAGAIAGVLALLPKSPESLDASFSGVTAYPEIGLEQYDARSSPAIVVGGHPTPASTGMVVYQLAADTTTLPTVASTAGEGTSSSSTSTPTTTSSTSTTPPSGTATTQTSTSTPTGAPDNSRTRTSAKRKGAKRRRAKRAGGKITTTSPESPYPQENPVQSQALVSPPPRRSFHPVKGALVTEGAGAPKSKVAAVVKALSTVSAPEPAPEPEEVSTSPNGEESMSTRGEPPPTASPPTGELEASGTTNEPATTRVVLSRRCRSVCGATQEIEKALTYDPNPIKAAEAVAALFNDSRSEVVGKQLYPIGAMIRYTVSLDGFAHNTATLEWSLIGRASRRPLPKPWWRDIVVAHIEPTVNHESISGKFWVPVPPERGDYLVQLVLRDSNGVAHASSDSTPTFH